MANVATDWRGRAGHPADLGDALDADAIAPFLLGGGTAPLLIISRRVWADDIASVSGISKVEAGGRELDLLLYRSEIDIIALDRDQAEIARAAWRRFGKGRHPAALNYGDCFAYSLAKSRRKDSTPSDRSRACLGRRLGAPLWSGHRGRLPPQMAGTLRLHRWQGQARP